MLAYVLACVIGLGSLGLYVTAFFFPEVHRKNDFIWSGIGFFYALVLWVYAERFRGGMLLGQTASVTLLVWLGWQTLKLRRQLTPLEQQTALPDTTSIQAKVGGLKSNLQKRLENLPISKTSPQPPEQVQKALSTATDQAKQDQPPSTLPILANTAAVSESGEGEVNSVPDATREAITGVPAQRVRSKTTAAPSTTDAVGPEAATSKLPAPPPRLQAATNLLTIIKNRIQETLSRGRRPGLTIQRTSKPDLKTSKPAIRIGEDPTAEAGATPLVVAATAKDIDAPTTGSEAPFTVEAADVNPSPEAETSRQPSPGGNAPRQSNQPGANLEETRQAPEENPESISAEPLLDQKPSAGDPSGQA